MIDFVINEISSKYKVTENNLGNYSQIKKSGMKFNIHSYKVAGIGNFSTIQMSAMFGLMKMQTVVFTALNKDAPLFSYDRILAMGNDTLLLELYNTQLSEIDVRALDEVKANGKDLADHDLGEHWYDPLKMSPTLSKRGKKVAEQFDALSQKFFVEYLNLLDNVPDCNVDEKQKKVADYVNGLFENGGPSTDQFIKMIGKDVAYELFSKYIFASAN